MEKINLFSNKIPQSFLYKHPALRIFLSSQRFIQTCCAFENKFFKRKDFQSLRFF